MGHFMEIHLPNGKNMTPAKLISFTSLIWKKNIIKAAELFIRANAYWEDIGKLCLNITTFGLNNICIRSKLKTGINTHWSLDVLSVDRAELSVTSGPAARSQQSGFSRNK